VRPLAGPVARVDLGALVHNYRQVLALVGPDVAVMAMVKADAYGHGDREVARALARVGCRAFGVATVTEGERVAGAVPGARILVLGGIAPCEAARVARGGFEVATQEAKVVRALGEAAAADGREISVHVKVDTGMHRLGVAPHDVPAFVEEATRTPGVRVVALCSHFAMAESVTTEVTAGQLERLLAVARELRTQGGNLACHLANSAAIMTRADAALDMVRPGLMLYGLYPDAALRDRADLKPVMTLEAPVVRVAEVGAGEGIGYGHSFRTRATSRIATLRCGYADGYPRALSNRGEVLIGGRRAAVVGRICMDHTMVDVTAVPGVKVGEVAQLWGPDLGAEQVAARADTISYELIARLGARVEREYFGA
jgi:alanine racemase